MIGERLRFVPRRAKTGRASRDSRPGRSRSFLVRTAAPDEASQIHALITNHLAEGHLLPRELGELTAHADRFVVATTRRTIVACGELAPLSDAVAEIRSLVVDRTERGTGIGRRLVEELRRRARRDSFDRLCAFTHQPAYFVRMGFSIVPHVWLPEKIATDCRTCPLFRRCGQYAMLLSLEAPREIRETSDARTAVVSLHA